ncbi:hypothetical protein TNCV_1789991 [Trichonephila clavipes]|nr:hypothetical protein TNCV_1789991 [Trichonephila clavipes]
MKNGKEKGWTYGLRLLGKRCVIHGGGVRLPAQFRSGPHYNGRPLSEWKRNLHKRYMSTPLLRVNLASHWDMYHPRHDGFQNQMSRNIIILAIDLFRFIFP